MVGTRMEKSLRRCLYFYPMDAILAKIEASAHRFSKTPIAVHGRLRLVL